MKRARVLLLNHESTPPDLARVEQLADVELAEMPRLEEQLERADAVYIWDFFWDRATEAFTTAWGERKPPEWVHIANVGVDKIDFPALADSRSVVTNSAGVYESAIAEHVLASYLFLGKRLRELEDARTAREWRRLETQPIAGARALVVGAGPIGRQIVQLLRAVGMRVELVARTARDDALGRIHGVDALHPLLAHTDLLVLAAPLTPETRHLIGTQELALLGSGGHIVNVGRGELIDDDALLAALREDRIAGAALDVFAVEPLPADSPFWDAPRCLITPHLSGTTDGWQKRLAAVFTRNLERWLAGEPLQNQVHLTRSGER